jgi:hypothetical protein
MIEQQLLEVLKEEGYEYITPLDMEGVEIACGLYRFVFTTGLVIGLDETGYSGRFCFPSHADAKEVLLSLKKLPKDLRKLPGNWIKFKGKMEFSNENYVPL